MIGVEVRPCPHGTGVFASKDFYKGELVAKVVGGRIDPFPLTKYHVPVPTGGWWSDIPKSSPSYWSNFLDDGGARRENVRFFGWDPAGPSASLIAVRDIKRGEELFLDYSAIRETIQLIPEGPSLR